MVTHLYYGRHQDTPGSDHPLRRFRYLTSAGIEDSPLGLDKSPGALWLVLNWKNGVSSCGVARDLGVKRHEFSSTLCTEAQRLRFAIRRVGADQTFIGGKPRKCTLRNPKRRIAGTGSKDKIAVMGILERVGKIRTNVVGDRKERTLQSEINKHVEAGSVLYTGAPLYDDGLEGRYAHQAIDPEIEIFTIGELFAGKKPNLLLIGPSAFDGPDVQSALTKQEKLF